MLLYACMLAVSLLNLSILFIVSTPDWRAMLVGYLGLLLMGGAFVSMGAFISTLTRNQIVAGAVTFCLFLLLWVLDWVGSYNTSAIGKICSYLAIAPHFEQFSKGVIELKDAVYYLSAIAAGLFLSKRSIESLRWRA
jgi:ABC-2 type transport system permease protein